ncbi:hypothetical protein KC929_01185 [Patescibacteria group bacterium]|nr:hypothetical protein [Patescibacteria group bacterium]
MKNILKASVVAGAALPFLALGQSTFGSILGTIANLINAIIPVLIALALAYFIYGVFKFIMASDADKKKDARSIVIQGVIGLFVIVSVWGLVGVIQATFGIGTGGTLDGSQLPSVCTGGNC